MHNMIDRSENIIIVLQFKSDIFYNENSSYIPSPSPSCSPLQYRIIYMNKVIQSHWYNYLQLPINENALALNILTRTSEISLEPVNLTRTIATVKNSLVFTDVFVKDVISARFAPNNWSSGSHIIFLIPLHFRKTSDSLKKYRATVW